ncbi:MAG: YceI family protein [bacterium]|nr:YceI family protein [bacterium]
MTSTRIRQVLAGMVAAAATAHIALADVPPRGESMQTLEVPDGQLDLGEVYHVFPGEDAQITITSDVSLRHLVAGCSRLVGYVVSPFDREGNDPPIAAGAFRLPAASLRTNLPDIDAVLSGKGLLHTGEHAEITGLIKRVSDVKVIEREDTSVRYELNLVVDLTVKGVTRELTVPAKVGLFPFTFSTMQARYPGDLMTIRADLKIKPADFELQVPPPLAPALAEELDVAVFLLLNTVPPDKSLDPAVPQKRHRWHLRFMTLLRDFDDAPAAYELGRQLTEDIWDDATALSALATTVAEAPTIRSRNLNFALRAARRADELTEHKDAATLDLLARIHYTMGDVESALKQQRRAVEHLEGAAPELVTTIRQHLTRYEAATKAATPASKTQK